MITLRPDDQEPLVAQIRAALALHQSVLCQCPTGFGKTVVAAYMAQQADQRGRRVIFGVHRKELARQTAATFDRFGIRYGFIASGLGADPLARVHIASADTLKNRPHLIKGDLFVPDEAHLWAAETRSRLITLARAAGMKIVGLSATPERLDGKPLAGLFDAMVCGPSVAWLMERGYLSRYRAFAPRLMDLSGIRSRGGDYATGDLDREFDKPAVIGDAIAHYRKYANGMRAIDFAFSRQNGRHACDAYNAAGIPAVYIDGETPDDERRASVQKMATGEAKVLVNVQLLTEGFDLSASSGRDVPIEAVILRRPTKSLPLAMQMMGRALRPKVAPAIILDHANLLSMHGLPDDPREWSLEGRKSGPSKPGERTMPTTICSGCFGIFRPAPACPYCGQAIKVEGRKVEQVDGELEEVDAEMVRRQRKMEVARARTIDEVARVAVERGYKTGWIMQTMKARGQPVSYAAVDAAWGRAVREKAANRFAA